VLYRITYRREADEEDEGYAAEAGIPATAASGLQQRA
jgi:hypothetical protein